MYFSSWSEFRPQLTEAEVEFGDGLQEEQGNHERQNDAALDEQRPVPDFVLFTELLQVVLEVGVRRTRRLDQFLAVEILQVLDLLLQDGSHVAFVPRIFRQ